MTYEAKLRNTIIRLKEAKRHQPTLTLQKISEHTGVSLTTVQRVFAEGSEDSFFKYESIDPIANMLLGLDSLDEGDEDEKALKAIIQLKTAEIEELKELLEKEKERHQEKLEKERAQYRASLDFLKHQIELKDIRIDRLMDGIEKRSAMYEELHQLYLDLVKK